MLTLLGGMTLAWRACSHLLLLLLPLNYSCGNKEINLHCNTCIIRCSVPVKHIILHGQSTNRTAAACKSYHKS